MTPALVFLLLAAPCVGSFLAVLTLRLPQGGDLLFGRSACPHCGVPLGIVDLVPLLSWLALCGRCRHCRSPIGKFYPAMELAALGVTAWAAGSASGAFLAISCLLGWALLALAVIDARDYILPDALTLPLIPAGLAVTLAFESDRLADHTIGAALGYSVLALLAWLYRRLRRRDGLGMGDAKLLAVAGAWTSWEALPGIVFLAAVIAMAVTASAALVHRHVPKATDAVPFGPYLAFATWVSWLYGPLVVASP